MRSKPTDMLQWEAGVHDGLGVETFPAGGTFHGEFVGGKRDGWGAASFANGVVAPLAANLFRSSCHRYSCLSSATDYGEHGYIGAERTLLQCWGVNDSPCLACL